MRVSRTSLIAAAVVLSVVVAGATFIAAPRLMPDRMPNAAGAEAAEAVPGPQYQLRERVLNLADPVARRYVKIAITLEFEFEDKAPKSLSAEERSALQRGFEQALAPWLPIIDDAIIALVSSKTSADLASPEGKLQLKNEIRDVANRAFGRQRVANVYFTQFVIQ